MRSPFLLLLFLCCAGYRSFSQFATTKSFTLTDGLPSNTIYDAIEDEEGFLWLSTDAGAVRFDGKQFQVFTTKNGLPDNEVLNVFKEKSGRMWVRSFKQTPAYFDPHKNRFINEKEDSLLKNVGSETLIYCYPTMDGGVEFIGDSMAYVFSNGRRSSHYSLNPYNFRTVVKRIDEHNYLDMGRKEALNQEHREIFLCHFQNNKIVDSRLLDFNKEKPVQGKYVITSDKLFRFVSQLSDKNKPSYLKSFSNIQTNPLRFQEQTFYFKKNVNTLSVTTHFIIAYYPDNSLEIFSSSMNSLQVIKTDDRINSVYEDRKGTLWACTSNSGLLKLEQQSIRRVPLPESIADIGFVSVTKDKNGHLFLGSKDSRIVETGSNENIIHAVQLNHRFKGWQRDILFSQNKVFAFSDVGSSINYSQPVIDSATSSVMAFKAAIALNDSVIVAGNAYNVFKLNTKTNGLTPLNKQRNNRVTCIAAYNDRIIYFGSTNGLHKLDAENKTQFVLQTNHPLFSERVASLCIDKDKIVWVATASNGVYALQNDSVITHLTSGNGLATNNVRCIATGLQRQLLIGTNEGVSLMNYEASLTHPSIQNISTSDGLTCNVVNKIFYDNDTFYIATDKGVSVLAARFSIAKYDIPVSLIAIKINERDTAIASLYRLNRNQQSISLQFAGIELKGHFNHFEYRIDQSGNWNRLDGTVLNLQLESGEHEISVLAADINGNRSSQPLLLSFHIATPFWEAWWFWLLIVLALQAVVWSNIYRRMKRRQQLKREQEMAAMHIASLELQAFTSLMNPHFMFNALNSIQHYINVQDRQNANKYLTDFATLIRKNFEAAQQSFISLDEELENINLYLRLEKMRFQNKFSYEIVVNESVETDNWMLPTMLLQPLVENALLHGILPSAIDGELSITLKIENQNLLIELTDNGIGISNSRAIKQDSQHNSKATELISKRLSSLSLFCKHELCLKNEPAYDDVANPGNKVSLLIPGDLYENWNRLQNTKLSK